MRESGYARAKYCTLARERGRAGKRSWVTCLEQWGGRLVIRLESLGKRLLERSVTGPVEVMRQRMQTHRGIVWAFAQRLAGHIVLSLDLWGRVGRVVHPPAGQMDPASCIRVRT